MIVVVHWKHLLSFSFMRFIVTFLLFIQSGDSIYNPPPLKCYLWHLYYNEWTQTKTKSLFFIDFPNPIWYIEENDWKSSSITSSSSYTFSCGVIYFFKLFSWFKNIFTISLVMGSSVHPFYYYHNSLPL